MPHIKHILISIFNLYTHIGNNVDNVIIPPFSSLYTYGYTVNNSHMEVCVLTLHTLF